MRSCTALEPVRFVSPGVSFAPPASVPGGAYRGWALWKGWEGSVAGRAWWKERRSSESREPAVKAATHTAVGDRRAR